MPRTIEQSRATAERARAFAKQFNLESDNNKKFADIAPERKEKIMSTIAGMRHLVKEFSKTSLAADKDVNQFSNTVRLAQENHKGNCTESASLALDYVVRNEPDASAEMYEMDPAVDHVFVVVDRDKDSDPTKPETWGPNAFVADPWADEVYPASELASPRAYEASETNVKRQPDGTPVHDTKIVKVTFDPSKHTLEPRKNMNTDYIRETESMESVDTVLEAYEKKSEHVVSALSDFKKDLEQEKALLNKKDGPIPKQQADVINKKIEAVQHEISRIGDEIKSNVANREDYNETRGRLENKLGGSLQNAKQLSQLSVEEKKTLAQDNRSFFDKLTGRSTKTPADKLDDASKKATSHLEKISDVNPERRRRDNISETPAIEPRPDSQMGTLPDTPMEALPDELSDEQSDEQSDDFGDVKETYAAALKEYKDYTERQKASSQEADSSDSEEADSGDSQEADSSDSEEENHRRAGPTQ